MFKLKIFRKLKIYQKRNDARMYYEDQRRRKGFIIRYGECIEYKRRTQGEIKGNKDNSRV